MRAFGRPIVGGMELICFCRVPSWWVCPPLLLLMKAHIFVDFIMEKLSPGSADRRSDLHEGYRRLAFPFHRVQLHSLRTGPDEDGRGQCRVQAALLPNHLRPRPELLLETRYPVCELLNTLNGGNHE